MQHFHPRRPDIAPLDPLDPAAAAATSTSSSTSPPPPPTDDAIEALILHATSARPASDARPLRDTRTQLFVGNLPYRVRWQDLKDLFRKAGTVLRADVSLGPDNRSRGYGTVLLATAEDAGRAVDMFNGYSWQTRILEVRLDRLLPEFDILASHTIGSSSGASTSTGSTSHPSMTPVSSHLGSTSSLADEIEYMTLYHPTDPSSSSRNLFVGNLPFHCQWQDLKDLFRQAGTILRADVALGPDGRSRGFGTVVFATDYDSERAVQMFNGYEYHGRVLKVNFDRFSNAGQPLGSSSVASGSNVGMGSGLGIGMGPGMGSPIISSPLPSATTITGPPTATLAGKIQQQQQQSMHQHHSSQSLSQPQQQQQQQRKHHLQPPGQLKLPPGFMYEFDYGSPSGPSSPYELFTQLQMQIEQERRAREQVERDTDSMQGRGRSQPLVPTQMQTQAQAQPHSQTQSQPQLQTRTINQFQPQTHPSASPLQRLLQPQPQFQHSQSQVQSPTQIHQNPRLAAARLLLPSKPPSVASAPASSSAPSTAQLDRDIDALTSTLASSTLSLPKYMSTSASSSSSLSNLSVGARSRAPSAAGVPVPVPVPKPLALSTASSGSNSYTSASASASAAGELGSSVSSRTSVSLSMSPSLGSGMGDPSLLEEEDAGEKYGREKESQIQGNEQGQGRGRQRTQQRYIHSHSQAQLQSQSHAHPHHPGPIVIPPPLPVGAFQPAMPMGLAMSPHTPHAASPLHHPAIGSPYHFYPVYATSAHQQHAQMQIQMQQQQQQQFQQFQQQHPQHQLTPQGLGLPPITPSMPPFTFLAPQALARQRQQQQKEEGRRRRVAGSGSGSASASASSSASSGGSGPASPRAKDAVTQYPSLNTAVVAASSSEVAGASGEASSSSGTEQREGLAQTGRAHAHSMAAAAFRPHPMYVPLPSPVHAFGVYPAFPSPPAFGNIHPGLVASPGLPSPHGMYPVYQTPQQHMQHIHQQHSQQQVPQQQHQQTHQLRLNLAGVHGSFSPGVAMSPGTFYGRPGEVVPNPNPWINAAVGAPVHVAEPGQTQAQSPGHGQGPTPQAYPTHGAYFYAMSSPKKALSGHEPKGYFDPMYFPAGASGYGGYIAATVGTSSGLANEIAVGTAEGGSAGEVSEVKNVEGKVSHAMSEGGAHEEQADVDEENEAEALDRSTISRTHSVGYTRKSVGGHGLGTGQVASDSPPPPPFSKSDSDPIQGWTQSVANAVASDDSTMPMQGPMSLQELRLPERVPWRTPPATAAAKQKGSEKGGK